MTQPVMVQAVAMHAALFGLLTMAGYLHPVGTFGRWLAPYALTGTISVLLLFVTYGFICLAGFCLTK